MVEFRTRAPGGRDDGSGGQSDMVEQALERVMDGLKENPKAQAKVASALQENYGVPPELLVSAFPDLAGAEEPQGQQPDPEGPAEAEPVDVPGQVVEQDPVTAEAVKGFLGEVADVHPKGWDATLADLEQIDDDLVDTALSMSDLPTG